MAKRVLVAGGILLGGGAVLDWSGFLGLGRPFAIAAAAAVLALAVRALWVGEGSGITVGTLGVVLLFAVWAGTATWALHVREERNAALLARVAKASKASKVPMTYEYVVFAGDDPEGLYPREDAEEWAEPSVSGPKADDPKLTTTHSIGEHVQVKCKVGDALDPGWLELWDGYFMSTDAIRRRPYSGGGSPPICAGGSEEGTSG